MRSRAAEVRRSTGGVGPGVVVGAGRSGVKPAGRTGSEPIPPVDLHRTATNCTMPATSVDLHQTAYNAPRRPPLSICTRPPTTHHAGLHCAGPARRSGDASTAGRTGADPGTWPPASRRASPGPWTPQGDLDIRSSAPPLGSPSVRRASCVERPDGDVDGDGDADVGGVRRGHEGNPSGNPFSPRSSSEKGAFQALLPGVWVTIGPGAPDAGGHDVDGLQATRRVRRLRPAHCRQSAPDHVRGPGTGCRGLRQAMPCPNPPVPAPVIRSCCDLPLVRPPTSARQRHPNTHPPPEHPPTPPRGHLDTTGPPTGAAPSRGSRSHKPRQSSPESTTRQSAGRPWQRSGHPVVDRGRHKPLTLTRIHDSTIDRPPPGNDHPVVDSGCGHAGHRRGPQRHVQRPHIEQ
jgi:hypothetical protein